MAKPKFRKKLVLDRALEPIANSPEEFAEFLAKDRVISARNVSQAGSTPQKPFSRGSRAAAYRPVEI